MKRLERIRRRSEGAGGEQVWEWLEGGTFAQELPDSGAATPDSAAAAPSSPRTAAAAATVAAGNASACIHNQSLTGELCLTLLGRYVHGAYVFLSKLHHNDALAGCCTVPQ